MQCPDDGEQRPKRSLAIQSRNPKMGTQLRRIKMKDTFYFLTLCAECEHGFVEEIFERELKLRGYELIYYRKMKNGHIPMQREAKTNAPRWVVLEICYDFRIEIIAGGFLYKKGVQDREVYGQGFDNLEGFFRS